MTRPINFLFLIQLVGLALSFSSQRLKPHRYDTSISLFGGGGGISKLPSPNGRYVDSCIAFMTRIHAYHLSLLDSKGISKPLIPSKKPSVNQEILPFHWLSANSRPWTRWINLEMVHFGRQIKLMMWVHISQYNSFLSCPCLCEIYYAVLIWISSLCFVWIHNLWNKQANFAFAAKLVKSLSWLPFASPDVYLLLSAASSSRVITKAQSFIKGAKYVGSLKHGIPDTFQPKDIVVVVSPCIQQDYQMVSQLAKDGVASGIVLINGLAKVSGIVSFCEWGTKTLIPTDDKK